MYFDIILTIGEAVGLLLIAVLYTFVIMLGIATGLHLVSFIMGSNE